ncbi:MAG: hypothetical protein R2865_10365 [Deinococcales bacterium]
MNWRPMEAGFGVDEEMAELGERLILPPWLEPPLPPDPIPPPQLSPQRITMQITPVSSKAQKPVSSTIPISAMPSTPTGFPLRLGEWDKLNPKKNPFLNTPDSKPF